MQGTRRSLTRESPLARCCFYHVGRPGVFSNTRAVIDKVTLDKAYWLRVRAFGAADSSDRSDPTG
jgi:hypothetical protein